MGESLTGSTGVQVPDYIGSINPYQIHVSQNRFQSDVWTCWRKKVSGELSKHIARSAQQLVLQHSLILIDVVDASAAIG